MASKGVSDNLSFKELFCRENACRPEEFETRLFWRSLHRHAIPLAMVLLRVSPSFFREDFDLLRDVGTSRSRGEVVNELNRFYGRNMRDRNWFRKHLVIRVSGKRVLRAARPLFRAQRSPSRDRGIP
jgi:hypothetical protein